MKTLFLVSLTCLFLVRPASAGLLLEEDVIRLGQMVMEHGGKPMPEPWYRRLFRGRTSKVVFLDAPIAIQIRG